MKKKKIKKSVKLAMAGILTITMLWSNNYHAVYADNVSQPLSITQPDIPQAQWQKYAKIALGGNSQTALAANGNLLSDTATAKDVERDQAETAVTDYLKTLSLKEQGAVSGRLPLKNDLTSVLDTDGHTLNKSIPTIDTWWWTGEPSELKRIDTTFASDKARKVKFADVVSSTNDTTKNYVPYEKYSCYVKETDTGYTPSGCTTAYLPGQVPLVDFEFDGGYELKKNILFHKFSVTSMQLTPTDKYTQTIFYDTNGSKSRTANVTRSLTPPYHYIVPSTAVQGFADFIEYDYPQRTPCLVDPTASYKCLIYPGGGDPWYGSNISQVVFPVYYDTFLPVKNTDYIEPNRELILFSKVYNPDLHNYTLSANYVKFSSGMNAYNNPFNTDTIDFPEVTNGTRREFHKAVYDSDTSRPLPVVTTPSVAVRPLLTMNPADILYFKNAGSGQTGSVGQTLNTDVQFDASAAAPVKPTIKDDSQRVTSIAPTDPNDPNILKIDNSTNTIYVKQNTSELNLKVNATYANDKDTTSYITAIGRDIYKNKTVLGRLAQSNTPSTNVTLDLKSNLLNTTVLGNKAIINLYTEELSDANKADYISKPLPVTVVVAQDQTIKFDSATQALNGSTIAYGDKDITIKALVDNNLQPYDQVTPIAVSIDTTDSGDAATAEVVPGSVTWNGKTVTAKVHLKDGIGGTDHKIKINIHKPASADGKYLEAPPQQIEVNVVKRAITITPLLTTLHVKDSYPPADWPYKAVKTTEPMVDGLANGDNIPYTFTTVDIGHSDGTVSPPLNTDGTIKDTALDKAWGINLTPQSTAAVNAFKDKYDVTLQDYHSGNKKSILQVKRTFDPIQQTDLKEQPQYVELQPDEHTAKFSTTFTYPLKDKNNNDIDAAYQDLSYQWYKKDALGKIEPFHPSTATMEILPNLSSTQGQVRFSFTIDPVQSDDNMTSYYCEVWNSMNVTTPIRTNTAELTMIQEPSSYVEYPSIIKVTNDSKGIQGDSSIELKDLTTDGKVQPKGTFEIQSDPEVKLFLNGDSTITDFNKIYTMKVMKGDGTQVADDKVLMKLTYPVLKEGQFKLKNDDTDKKDWGIYQGTMNFTMTYKPHKGTSP